MPATRLKPMRCITALEQGQYKCWMVRVGLATEFCDQRTFIYREYGSKGNALIAAKRYRDGQEFILEHQYCLRFELGYNQNKESVYLNSRIKNDVEYFSWIASFWNPTSKKQLKKSYSVIKYGFREAKKLAYHWRDEKRRLEAES